VHHYNLNPPTASLIHSVLGEGRAHELGSALLAIAGAVFFGLGFGRVLQLVHARAATPLGARQLEVLLVCARRGVPTPKFPSRTPRLVLAKKRRSRAMLRDERPDESQRPGSLTQSAFSEYTDASLHGGGQPRSAQAGPLVAG